MITLRYRPSLPRIVHERCGRRLASVAALALSLGGASCSPSVPSSYFRVTAHLMHRDEPVTLDWVVECRYTKLMGDMSGVRAAVVPYVFGVATRDGGMVLMVAPNACGLREPDRTNLPFFMWGDRAGDFTFFTAYATRQAFADPAAQIQVLDVEVRPSDRAEHDAWARTAPKNVVPDHPDPFRQDSFGRPALCLGFVEVAVPPAFADAVRRLRPAGEPRYWLVPEEVGVKIAEQQHSFLGERNHAPLTEGQGLDAMERRWPIRVFPFGDRDYFVRHLSGPDRKSATDTAQVAVDLARPGMMSCGAMPNEAERHGLTAFAFPDGVAPPTPMRPDDDTTIISDDGHLFLQTLLFFSIERGLEDHP